MLHFSLFTFPFQPQKGNLFPLGSYIWLQEAVFYLGCPGGAQQSVSLAGLFQPVLLWKGVSSVLRHGVGLLPHNYRAEGEKNHSQVHTVHLITKSYTDGSFWGVVLDEVFQHELVHKKVHKNHQNIYWWYKSPYYIRIYYFHMPAKWWMFIWFLLPNMI